MSDSDTGGGCFFPAIVLLALPGMALSAAAIAVAGELGLGPGIASDEHFVLHVFQGTGLFYAGLLLIFVLWLMFRDR